MGDASVRFVARADVRMPDAAGGGVVTRELVICVITLFGAGDFVVRPHAPQAARLRLLVETPHTTGTLYGQHTQNLPVFLSVVSHLSL